MQENAINIRRLCKRHKGRYALKDVNLQIKHDEYLRRVEKNRAGKTEPIRSTLNFCQLDHQFDQIFDAERHITPARQQLPWLREQFINGPGACDGSDSLKGTFLATVETEAGRHAAA